MTQIYVDLDESFVFYPVYEGSPHHHDWMVRKPFRLEVDQALIDEYEAASRAFSAVREKLEQLYRVQEGLTPWESSPVPEHKLLGCGCRTGECESKTSGCRMTAEIKSGEAQ
jgi:hypothetical protein